MTMLRPESEMKDSGIEWIGKMPFNWELHRIRNNYRIITGNGFKPELQGRDSGKYPVCKASDISSAGSTLFSAVNYIDETIASEEHFNIIPANSIIFPKIGEAMKKNNRTRVLVDCCVDNNCQGLVPQVINPVYSYYLLSCIDMRWFDNAGTIPSLNNQKLKDCKIPYPSLAEQHAIASYLDDRCSKLDEIITEAEKSIEEYKELKQAVIFEAVTKGLDKNVPMKDSGIEWVGAIPSHWLVKKFKYVASVNANLVSPDDYMDYQQIAPDCIEKDSGRLIKDRTVSEAGVESWNQLFRKGQLIYSKIRPILNKVIIAPYDGLCSADMYPLDVIEDIEFVQKAMLSKYFVEQVGLITQDRVKMPKINKEELSNILMVIPPRDEQVEIVKYLKTRLEGFDELIDEKQSLIEDLKAYKKSLIYEVVTGKRRIS